MIKKILSIIMLWLCLCFCLTGCRKLVNIEYSDVEVTVVDSYYSPMWLQPIIVGKTTSFITHPAIYRITVEYNDLEFNISGSDTYNKYKNKTGETTIGVLEIYTYDDNTVRYNISELE